MCLYRKVTCTRILCADYYIIRQLFMTCHVMSCVSLCQQDMDNKDLKVSTETANEICHCYSSRLHCYASVSENAL